MGKYDKPKDLIRRSDQLDDKLDNMPNSLDKTVAGLVTYGRQNRTLIRWLTVSIVLELFLAIGFMFVLTQQQINSNTIKTNRNAIITSCNSGNEFRKDNLELWQHILAIPPTTPQTDEQIRTREEFTTFINNTFAPRDCSKL